MKKAPEQLQRLERRHQALERELHALSSHPYLTAEEHQHLVQLKKRKLQTKDGIVALRQALASA